MKFKTSIKVLALLVIFSLLGSVVDLSPLGTVSVQAAGNTYYVSSSSGSDSNSGTSEASPWKTLSKVSSMTFQPGDSIKLKGGDLWDDEFLVLHGSGVSGNPITLTSYGTGRPKIRYKGMVVTLKNESFWTIKGLEVEVLTDSTITGGGDWVIGIEIAFDETRGKCVYSDILVDDNLVYGNGIDRTAEGIRVMAYGENSDIDREVAKNITISNNTIHDIGCFALRSVGWKRAIGGEMISSAIFHNLKFHKNTIYNIGLSPVIMQNANHSSMKWNVIHHGGAYTGSGAWTSPGGVWPIRSSYVEMKFNEVYEMSDSNYGADGSGVNVDWSNEYVTMQYNYAHDNKGNGITSMANIGTKILNNKVKGNVGTNIGKAQIALCDFSGEYERYSGLKNMEIANNMIIVNKENTYAIHTQGNPGIPYEWVGNSFHHNNIVLDNSLAGVSVFSIIQNSAVASIDYNRVYSNGAGTFRAQREVKDTNGNSTIVQYSTLQQWQNDTVYDDNTQLLEIDSVLPGSVSNLSAVPSQSEFAMNLSWTAASDSGSGVDHYNVYRSTDPNFIPAYKNMVGESTTTTFIDKEELQSNTVYYYKVEAEDRNGNVSPATSAVNATSGTQGSQPIREFQASKDFGLIQQGPVWYYQMFDGSSYSNFTSVYAEGSIWREGTTYLFVGAKEQHPHSKDAVRKWVAPFDGTITVTANGNITAVSSEDGVRVKMLKGSTQIWPSSGWQMVTSSTPISFPATQLSVNKGDALYFIVNQNVNIYGDKTVWDPVITYTSVTYPTPSAAPVVGAFIKNPLMIERVNDNFEDGNADGWTTVSGNWSVVTDGTKVFKQSSTSGGGNVYIGDASWKDYTVEAKIKPISFDSSGGSVGINVMYADPQNRYSIELNKNNFINVKKFNQGNQYDLAYKTYAITPGTTYSLKIEVYRDGGSGFQSIGVYINGLKEMTAIDNTRYGNNFTGSIRLSGKVALDTWGASAGFDDVSVNAAANIWGEPQDVVMYDNFEDGDMAGWSTVSGNWSVGFDKSRKLGQTGNSTAVITTGESTLDNYAVESNIKLLNTYSSTSYARLGLRYTDNNNKYFVYMSNTAGIGIKKVVSGTETLLIGKPYTINVGTEYKMKAVINGSTIDLYLNGKKELTSSDTALTSGKAALETVNANAVFDEVAVQKLEPSLSVLFSDDFEDGNDTGWNKNVGVWSVADGPTKVYKQSSAGSGLAYAGESTWRNYIVKARVKFEKVNTGYGYAHIDFRYKDNNNKYTAYISDNGFIEIMKDVSGVRTWIAGKQYYAGAKLEYRVKIVVNGTSIDMYINGKKELSVTDTSLQEGMIALETWNASVTYDDILVQSVN